MLLSLLLLAQVASFFIIELKATEAGLPSTQESIVFRKCVVNGTAYTHSQTIESKDPNCHCLCVAGEVYCWWENYKAINNPSTINNNEIDSSIIVDYTEVKVNDKNTTKSSINCIVMGKEYKVGEILPHLTGNCVECSCGREGHVECSPRNCVAFKNQYLPQSSKNINQENNDNQIDLFSSSHEHGIDENF
ncbi:hypothetical protein HCN44_006526 [Aphidius gifuensis]|uniref:Uncharacterized protein n=1 Tax=Aphidius gifuensis TaxID=684658 RepID=A0A835CTU0_APHGI|nr:uncharacterized protein LOC122850187 [Aphidius gifuensis]KAF7995419.1 hypothetical protein HCN44_006526 [Aphidius gifuensis]